MISTQFNLAAATITANTGSTSSQEASFLFDTWSGKADVHWWNKKVVPEYSLSKIQVVKLNNLRVQHDEKITPIQNKLVKLRMAFDGLEMNVKDSSKKLKSNKVKIWKLEDEILEINKEMELQIKKILNNVQLEFFNSGGYDWWSIVDSCWSSAHDKLLNRNQRMLMSDRGFSW